MIANFAKVDEKAVGDLLRSAVLAQQILSFPVEQPARTAALALKREMRCMNSLVGCILVEVVRAKPTKV